CACHAIYVGKFCHRRFNNRVNERSLRAKSGYVRRGCRKIESSAMTQTQTSPTSTRPRRDDGTALIELDPWLEPYADHLRARYAYYKSARAKIDQTGGLLGPISQGHHYFGFNRGEQQGKVGVWYREWAPAAYQLSLVGDFNGWDRNASKLSRDSSGVWSIFLPDEQSAF